MKTRIVFFMVIVLLFATCKRDETEEVRKMEELVISDSFKWETINKAHVTIMVELPAQIGKLSRIRIFDKPLADGGVLLASGSAGYNYPWETNIVIPAGNTSILVQLTDALGNQQTAVLDVAENMMHTFGTQAKESGLKMFGEPPCEGDQVISGGGNVTISGGQTYLVSGSFTGNLNFQNGTVIVCGNMTVSDLNVGNNCSLVLTATGSLTANNLTLSGDGSFYAWHNTTVRINQLNQNNQNCGFYNYSADAVLSGSAAGSGSFVNDGTLTVNGGINRNAGGFFLNYGTLTVNGALNVNQDFENYGSLLVGGDVNFNTPDTFINDCRLEAGGSISFNNGTLSMNGGYIRTPNNFTVNGSGNMELFNQSMLSVGNMTLNNNMTGGGSTSSIVVSGTSTINGNRKVSGPVEWADNDGVLTNGSATTSFINGATFVTTAAMTNAIAVSECNPEGTGSEGVDDADGDGISDALDEYPEDATRAFNNYYPSEEGWAGLAFEDLWPEKGDYDFNDLVVRFRYNLVANASNRVVEINASYQAMAVGAAYRNGFGVQFDLIDPSKISSVSGQVRGENYVHSSVNGTEAFQEKAVVIPWDNVEAVIQRAGGSMFNTVPNGFVGTSDIVNLLITFVHPMHPDSVGAPPFNPFLIRQMKREHEIHLVDHRPTSLMDISLFGTVDDASVPSEGKYFRTADNLTWGIQLPEEFDYPIEHAEVTEAHLKFSSWAESNGSNPHDWYKNKNGYRNSNKIYRRGQ